MYIFNISHKELCKLIHFVSHRKFEVELWFSSVLSTSNFFTFSFAQKSVMIPAFEKYTLVQLHETFLVNLKKGKEQSEKQRRTKRFSVDMHLNRQ